jgi:hypothetical protein
MSHVHKSWFLCPLMAFKLIGSMTSNLYILKGQGEVMLNRGAEGVFILSLYILHL